MSLSRFLFNIGGSIIRPFVRIEAAPANIRVLEIDANRPVIYVLENRGWTDLSVLSRTCRKLGLPLPLEPLEADRLKQWRSVYTIAPRQPFMSWLTNQPKRSAMLKDILEALTEDETRDVQFIPVSILWGRPVAKQKHWLHILFADSWSIAGRTRKALTILFNGRQTLINFSHALSFRELISEAEPGSDIATIDRTHEALSRRLFEMRQATLGPDVSHRHTLVRKLLANDSLKAEIKNRAKTDDISELKATLVARKYLYETVADCSSITISLMQRGLTRFWNKFYSGIEVGRNEELSRLALTHSLVYVPCHRSHVDYLLLSYVIHSHALALPYIAAGRNLNMPVIGAILRGGGAFFIRRSFKGDALYATALFEYVAQLVSTGMPIEYFIEGGRSRTGRLLSAKPGMLAMTVRAYLKYRSRPVAFIPVYIGYEKMIEGGSYLSELSGKEKKSETLLNSIRSILRIRGAFGRVYNNFGEPILLDEVLSSVRNNWAEEAYDDNKRPEWLHRTVNRLGQQILTNINACTSVNATNLVSTVLLTTPNHRMDESELAALLDAYTSLLAAPWYSDATRVTTQTGMEQIRHAEKLKLARRKKHELGDIIVLDRGVAKLMPYYRSNTLHLFVLPSVIACCFNTTRTIGREKIHKLVKMIYPYLRKELYLVWDSKGLHKAIDDVLARMVEQSLLIRNEALDVYTKPSSGSIDFLRTETLAQVISPLLELYYLTISIIAKKSGDDTTFEEMANICHLMSQHVALIHELHLPDFADKTLIVGLIEELIKNGYLKINGKNRLIVSDVFLNADKEVRLLLSSRMRSNILQMIRNRDDL